jgi:hypothetical protein
MGSTWIRRHFTNHRLRHKDVVSRKECVECHTDESPVWVQAWKRSSHANLDKIRNLKPGDPTFYKKGKLEEVEKNLRSMGKLAEGENLKEVGCIDCHVEIGAKKKADHAKDLKMPTADVCGTCHLQEFAERESERDTMIWPAGQWPDGRPSHALDYKATWRPQSGQRCHNAKLLKVVQCVTPTKTNVTHAIPVMNSQQLNHANPKHAQPVIVV